MNTTSPGKHQSRMPRSVCPPAATCPPASHNMMPEAIHGKDNHCCRRTPSARPLIMPQAEFRVRGDKSASVTNTKQTRVTHSFEIGDRFKIAIQGSDSIGFGVCFYFAFTRLLLLPKLIPCSTQTGRSLFNILCNIKPQILHGLQNLWGCPE